MRVTIITVSDSVSSGKREDRSGPALRARCEALGWEIGPAVLLPDDEASLKMTLADLADSGATDVILTSGGTGIGPRDVTPEATAAVVKKVLPGISERMRAEGQKVTPRACLSRAIAGIRGNAIVVNLPGSPRGAVESLDAIADLLPHAIDVLRGASHD